MTTYERTGGSTPTAYLDTSLVFGIASQDLDDEQDALLEILRASKQGTLNLVTSHVTSEEIQKGTDTGLDEAIYALLKDVPAVEEQWLFPRPVTNRGGSRLGGPEVVKEADLGALESILPHEEDARHVFQAVRNHVDYFVTVDRRSILRYADELRSSFGIHAVLPSELIVELGL